jgi:tetratricopeptide (TPR) repeat protein
VRLGGLRRLAWLPAVLVAGCAGGGAVVLPGVEGVPEGAPARGCEIPGGLGVEELGVSLAGLASGVPADSAALRALVEEAGEGLAVNLTMAPVRQQAAPIALEGVAGKTRCPIPDDRMHIAGRPPRLLVSAVSLLAEERLAQADRLLARRHFPEARAAFLAARAQEAVDRPFPEARVGDAYAAERRWGEALAIYRRLVQRFPWSFAARARLGWALQQTGRTKDALAELGRALALRPGDRQVRRWLALERLAGLQAPVPPPAERTSEPGQALWVVRPRPGEDERFLTDEARAYATCKEAFRSSPALRAVASGQEMPTWRWSPAEESVCTMLWIAAYRRHRERGRAADDALEGLWEIAQSGHLHERALFDVGGWAHPHAPALLDPQARARLFAFVARYRVWRREGAGWLFP